MPEHEWLATEQTTFIEKIIYFIVSLFFLALIAVVLACKCLLWCACKLSIVRPDFWERGTYPYPPTRGR